MPTEDSRRPWRWDAQAQRVAERIIKRYGEKEGQRELRVRVNNALRLQKGNCRASESRIQRLYTQLTGGIQKQRAIAILISEVDDTFVGLLLHGFLKACHELGRPVLIAESAADPRRELEELERLAPYAAGIVMVPIGRDKSKPAALLEVIKRVNLPIVFLERSVIHIKEDVIHTVKTANVDGGVLAAEHLVERLKFAIRPQAKLFLITKDKSTGQRERQNGFEDAIEEAERANALQVFTVRPKGRSFTAFTESVDEAVTAIVQCVNEGRVRDEGLRREGPVGPYAGVFCTADNLALATMARLRDSATRVKIPQEVLMVGFDDLFAAEAASLTTIKQDFERIGRTAVDRVMTLIDKRQSRSGRRLTSVELTGHLTDTDPVPLWNRNGQAALQKRGSTGD